MNSIKMYLSLINFYLILFHLLGCSSGNGIENSIDKSNDISLSMTIDEINSSSSLTCQVSLSYSQENELTIVDKGVCYSSDKTTPTISDNTEITSSSSLDNYSVSILNLKETTTYYIRPFVRTKEYTYYGYVQYAKTLGISSDYYPTDKNEKATQYDGYEEIWSDEFNIDGAPATTWSFESGFVRNEELQWYQKDNANVKDGCLVIEGRKETITNPNYISGSTDWKTSHPVAQYTSSSLTTADSFNFMYGRLEVRAKIPTATGSWPAIWTLGNLWEWPLCGEIDLMEYYLKDNQPTILANACWGGNQQWSAMWDESKTALAHFTTSDAEWCNKFHLWRMDWDKNHIQLYLDDELLNEIDVSQTQNGGWQDNYQNPFNNTVKGFGHYILLNLAIGGNGGTPDDSDFPLKYKIDYVRVYQKEADQ